MPQNKILTPTLITREILRLLTNAPWELRGSRAFLADYQFTIDHHDMDISIDAFSNLYLSDVTLKLLTNKRFVEVVPVIEAPPRWEFFVILQNYRGFTLRMLWHFNLILDSFEVALTCTYAPPTHDYDMPTYFWLGELAEAA